MLSVITQRQFNQYQTRSRSGYNICVIPKAPNLGGFFIGGKMETKVCTKCGIEKELEEFYKNTRYPDKKMAI